MMETVNTTEQHEGFLFLIVNHDFFLFYTDNLPRMLVQKSNHTGYLTSQQGCRVSLDKSTSTRSPCACLEPHPLIHAIIVSY